MSLLSREQVAARLKQLPSLPAVVTRLLDSFANEEIDTAAIARQIALDQGLTARVLRVANSSFYGLQSRVGTINEAVVVLGFRAVRSMVLAVCRLAAACSADPAFHVLVSWSKWMRPSLTAASNSSMLVTVTPVCWLISRNRSVVRAVARSSSPWASAMSLTDWRMVSHSPSL